MSGRHAQPSRLGHLYREIAKFGAVGALGIVVNLAAFNLIERIWHLPTVRAGVVATLVAIVGNYAGFRYFAYRDRDKGGRARELTLFLLFSAIGLVIENGVLYAATYGLGWDSQVQSNVVKFAGIGVATLFRFWSYRSWVFRALPEHQPEDRPEHRPEHQPGVQDAPQVPGFPQPAWRDPGPYGVGPGPYQDPPPQGPYQDSYQDPYQVPRQAPYVPEGDPLVYGHDSGR